MGGCTMACTAQRFSLFSSATAGRRRPGYWNEEHEGRGYVGWFSYRDRGAAGAIHTRIQLYLLVMHSPASPANPLARVRFGEEGMLRVCRAPGSAPPFTASVKLCT